MRNSAARVRRSRALTQIIVTGVVVLGVMQGRVLTGNPPVIATSELVADLLKRAGVQRGICSVLGGAGDQTGSVALNLARSSELLVHVREPRADAAADLRKEAEAAGFDIRRLIVEQGRLDRLPYADNLVDVVIATQVTSDILRTLTASEVLRVLRPEGTAILGGDAQLKTWLAAGKADGIETWEDEAGTWVQFSKPPFEGVDDWTHWERGPDNNPVSTDKVIKAPYMTQFMARPFNIGMPSVTVAAGGRTFLAVGHIAHHRREWNTLQKLIARNGYNGTVLWERDLPAGYLAHRSAFVASKDTFYMIDGDRCLRLDSRTGEEKGSMRVPEVEGAWKWMAMDDGVLYVLAGKPGTGVEITRGDRTFGGWSWGDLSKGYYPKRIPFGFGDTLAAYDLERKKLLWKHKEETLIDSRGMAVSEGRVYFYCPDRHLRAVSADKGDVLWTNADAKVFGLIEEPGRGLTSTPGFRTACMTVATPKALIIQGQTRMNVVAVSTEDGRMLWTKKKITNNPNAIYADGNLVLGVGPGGSHLVIDPESGEVLGDLKFRKVSCTRLTATPDSFFCRGEGTLRFDRYFKKVLVDGAIRPACNDGALSAGGMLYLGPWQCDCNLSLKGCIAKCSAGDFRFDHVATEADRLQRAANIDQIAAFRTAANDWPTYRSNTERSAGTKARVAESARRRWDYTPKRAYMATAPIAAGGLVFVGGDDGKVRALDGGNGALRWEFATSGRVRYPPTIWEGRAYVGSGDGHVYALEAATGRLLWKFRGAPVERHIMVYGAMTSTWPVHSGVLVHDGVAYFAAGIIDYDGTYVYALDAKSGEIRWQNNSSGHLNKELRKGVSAQGILTVQGGHLLLAGGNQVSPARFDLETGECLARTFAQGRPKANNGRFVGVLQAETVIAGGQTLYAPAKNVSTKGSFMAFSKGGNFRLTFGAIPPAWDESTFALVNFKQGKVTGCGTDKVIERIGKGLGRGQGRRARRNNLAQGFSADGTVRWQSDLGDSTKFEAVSLTVCQNAVVAVVRHQQRFRAQTQWFVVAFDAESGRPLYQHELRAEPLPGGLLIDAKGQVVVTTLDGKVLCFGA